MAKWLALVFLFFLLEIPIAYGKQPWTLEDTQAYYKGLSIDKQKDFIKGIISKLHEDLPIQIDDVTSWIGFFYLPSTNTITRVIQADVPYNSLDQEAIDEFANQTKIYSINNLCSKNMFKMFMFVTDTIIRVECDYASGQRLYSWSMTKDDCLEAGYIYP